MFDRPTIESVEQRLSQFQVRMILEPIHVVCFFEFLSAKKCNFECSNKTLLKFSPFLDPHLISMLILLSF